MAEPKNDSILMRQSKKIMDQSENENIGFPRILITLREKRNGRTEKRLEKWKVFEKLMEKEVLKQDIIL